jgi:hypothetical protein
MEKKNKQIAVSLVHYNETLLEIMRRFPEIKTGTEKQVKKLEKLDKYYRIIVGTAYSSRDSFPMSLSVKIECYETDNSKPYTLLIRFICKWVLE